MLLCLITPGAAIRTPTSTSMNTINTVDTINSIDTRDTMVKMLGSMLPHGVQHHSTLPHGQHRRRVFIVRSSGWLLSKPASTGTRVSFVLRIGA